jgi:hypothetical protein
MTQSPSKLLCELSRLGATATVENGTLVVRPGSCVPAELIHELRRLKPALMQHLILASIDPEDRSTWPPYLIRLESHSRKAFGEEAARRQVRAELAFLKTGADEGWLVSESTSTGAA